MIPATALAAALWWWAARLRARPGAPRVLQWLPLAIIVAVAVAWAVSIAGFQRAFAAATGETHEAAVAAARLVGRRALLGLWLALAAAAALLAVTSLTRAAPPRRVGPRGGR